MPAGKGKRRYSGSDQIHAAVMGISSANPMTAAIRPISTQNRSSLSLFSMFLSSQSFPLK